MNKKITVSASIVFGLIMLSGAIAPKHAEAASPCAAANVRWANSSNRIYVTGDVACTLTDIKTLGSASIPLSLVDPVGKVWFLGANLFLQEGATLVLHGSAIGGDVNELRLKSNNLIPGDFVFVRAEWGTIDMDGTAVTSWDEDAQGPDTEYETYQRAFIHVRSRLSGVTPRESRMDIRNSDVGYLGYAGAEAYGLTWKVTTKTYDTVGVFGDVVSSTIHNNYFGIYTYGAEAMTFIDNEVSDNVKYGIDPHDDSDFLVIEGNNVHGNGTHGIICSQRCNDLSIVGNTSSGNGGNGIMLHRNANDSLVEGNTVNDNVDSGIAIFDSHRNTVRNNTAIGNAKGIRLSVGSSENLIEDNTFASSSKYGLYFYKGTDAATVGDGRLKLNVFRGNTVSGNESVGAKIRQADDNVFQGNAFIGNGSYVTEIRDSNGNTLEANTMTGNVRNYYYGSSNSNTTVANSDVFAVKIGDPTSVMTVTDPTGAILKNSKGLPTVVAAASSSVVVTRALVGSSIVSFERLPFTVLPLSGYLSVKPIDWLVSGALSKEWEVSGTADAVTATYHVGDLEFGTDYDVRVNGEFVGSYSADANGSITFVYAGVFETPAVFTVDASL
jgi:parallel beta-helix repeat protein